MATAISESSSGSDVIVASARKALAGSTVTRPVVRRSYQDARPIATHVMNERLFKSVIQREHRRTDRAARSFIVVLVNVDGVLDAPIWDDVIEGLATAKRDTDYLGWYRTNETLGLILTEVSIPAEDLALVVDARVQRALARRVRLDVFARLTDHISHSPG